MISATAATTTATGLLIDTRSNDDDPDEEDSADDPEGKGRVPTLACTLLCQHFRLKPYHSNSAYKCSAALTTPVYSAMLHWVHVREHNFGSFH